MKEAKGKKGVGAVAKRDVKEKVTKVQDKDIKKRKGPVKEPKGRKAKSAKKAKDPNAPKRPATAFFIFLNEFREVFKKENPNVKGVAAVGKAGGEKWKSMSEAEKQPYMQKAVQKKSEYDKTLSAYNKKQDDDEEDEEVEAEESDKSKSEINDDEEDEEEDEDLED
ncbi:non-histone chromosomal protein 6 [Physcomitrium patens]|jgi:hypothetical protein|uniref:HMG box domain-containing protein n=1 Tax=Physcomitrium patens TaxID=3218 RepID=A0A2K1IE58_PHYPA|nr:HMG1/2-like protein [Physcomitrium patens]XP_024364950.1 HMG1/2-like protein [Physcomitrium patens]XP_024364951.1 HMG1/2-like protein [Physcomitrium patens]XP_024364952.1 HMG1/2-like protein [Physcomitrium patens]PNR27565.1 hypothetical protein PHYPA_029717 [Physcomitrium patens]|eukprot:XP_024364949.1 HMG1/2-like protein [Physcomitrella patens]